MATDLGTETITVASQNRTWRINIETPYGVDPVITVWRERVSVAGDGSVTKLNIPGPQPRNGSAIAAENQPFTPATPGQISGTELTELIAARADMWCEADAAAATKVIGP